MLQDKVKQAEDVLKLAAELSAFYYQKPLIVTYSGGKDSDVMLDIAKKCLQPEQFEVMYHLTTVDAPETYYHVKKVFADLEKMGIHTDITKPYFKGKRISMWRLIEQKSMPPTRLVRYCCDVLKETSTPNRIVAVGVREAESKGREGRDSFSIRVSRKNYKSGGQHYFGADHIREQWQASKQASNLILMTMKKMSMIVSL